MCNLVQRLYKRISAAFGWRWRYLREQSTAGLRAVQADILIRIKWWRDGWQLPLTTAHYPLYKVIHSHYKEQMGFWPDLVHCRDFNDKIQWLKLFDQDERMIQCSDKIAVRKYISDKVGDSYLVDLYQVVNRYDEFDFEKLPRRFALKANHDSGSVILVHEKTSLNHEDARKSLNAAINTSYGYEKGEWGYSCFGPRLFAEELIGSDGHTPADYKFHCVDGRVRYLHFIYGRDQAPRELLFDRAGNVQSFNVYFPRGTLERWKKPSIWDEVISVAETVAKGFKYVRVDMFLSENRIYVGELTFWPMAGCYHGEGQKILGRALDFDRASYKEPIYQKYKREFA